MKLTEALKNNDNEKAFEILVAAEKAYREKCSDELDSIYLGWEHAEDDSVYKFTMCSDSSEKFDILDFCSVPCLEVLERFIRSGGEETGCDEPLVGGCLRCCVQNMSLAKFLHTMFKDEYEELLEAMSEIKYGD